MALSAIQPIKPKGLGNYEDPNWNGSQISASAVVPGGAPAVVPGLAVPAQINDSVADNVAALAGTDSKLNQMARTEALKFTNRRGLLNSSLSSGASMDAVLKNALPIASQDAAQAYGKNMAARGFEFNMAMQNDSQEFAGGQADLDRALQVQMQQTDQMFRGTQADLERGLQLQMQNNTISAATAAQIRDIAATKGLAEAERVFTAAQNDKNRTFTAAQNAAQIATNEKIASWNIKSSDRNAAASMVLNTENMYANATAQIMANTSLSAPDRAAQLKAAKLLHDKQMSAVEQLYNIDINWGASTTTPAKPATPAKPGTPAKPAAPKPGTQAPGNYTNPRFENGMWVVNKNGVPMRFNPDAYKAGKGYLPV